MSLDPVPQTPNKKNKSRLVSLAFSGNVELRYLRKDRAAFFGDSLRGLFVNELDLRHLVHGCCSLLNGGRIAWSYLVLGPASLGQFLVRYYGI